MRVPVPKRSADPWLLLALVGGCSSYDMRLLHDAPDADGGERDGMTLSGSGGNATSAGGVGPGGDAGPGMCGALDDPDNCGTCGNVCSAEHGEAACARGMCWIAACDPGFANCDEDRGSCETSTRELATCSGCNSPCLALPHAVTTCEQGTCAVARCEPGFGNCNGMDGDGCETSLSTLDDCSACDTPCNKKSCAGGICTDADCDAGEGDCDGDGASCETNLFADPDNCGSCGTVCAFGSGVTPHGDHACTEQGCAVSCDADFSDCDDDYQTGCEATFVDDDGDGFANCIDACPDDPLKQQAGVCGCGNPESDADGDTTLDCDDLCPKDPSTAGECLGFPPATFDPSPVDWSTQPSATLDCGTTTIDSTDPDGSGPLVATITGWCGTAPTPIAQDQIGGGPQVVIIPLSSLTLTSGNTLRLIGARPIVIAVDGNVTNAGTIDANGTGTTPGAGANWSCSTSAGGNSSGGSCSGGAAGGGGGGFDTTGGRGGSGGGGSTGAGGVTRGNTDVVPLHGGCLGGTGGGDRTDAAAGAGGGAVQITAAGTLTISGTVRANGGSGANGSCGDESGGGGGGSGGAIVLEATTVSTTGATITVNGGKGGNSGSNASGGSGSTSSSANGQAGGNGGANGGGGGGGGYGRTRTITH